MNFPFPCRCSVFSCRKRHKESSCQAANLYSCEGHVRRHGTRHKSEISLVISHPHCALMSIGDRSGLFWACGELKYLRIKGQKCKTLASHIDSAACLSAFFKVIKPYLSMRGNFSACQSVSNGGDLNKVCALTVYQLHAITLLFSHTFVEMMINCHNTK